jgi:hypothetical protein
MADNKKIFKIPVSWEVYGQVMIEAESIEEAIKIFKETEDEISLPLESNYVDGSFKLNDEETTYLINSEN